MVAIREDIVDALQQRNRDLLDTIHNCLIAAGGSEDIDELEHQLNQSGTKPSDFIRKQFESR